MLEKIKKWFAEIGETGQHHLLVLTIVAAVTTSGVALVTRSLEASVFAFAIVCTWWSGYYGGRERIFELAGGDESSGGRWRDFIWSSVALAVAMPLALWALL